MQYTTYQLTIRIPHVGAPPHVRLRGALKLLLRSFSIQCTDAREVAQHVTAKPKSKPPGDVPPTIHAGS